MKSALSPKELAEAIGVSESSLKRWADAGRLHVSKTVGGHRRIAVPEAIRFARTAKLKVVRPDLLGLTLLNGDDAEPPTDDAERLLGFLQSGEAEHAHALLTQRYLDGTPLAELFDGPLRQAMHELGQLWRHDRSGIYIEHRATDIALQCVNHFRNLVRCDDNPQRPLALGGAPPGDSYLMTSMMAACLAVEAGYRDVNLGPETPLDTFADAVEAYKPRLVWFACTVSDACPHPAELAHLADQVADANATLVLGGQGLPQGVIEPRDRVHLVQTMAEFQGIAQAARD